MTVSDATRRVSVRLSLDDAARVKQELREVGETGQRSLDQIKGGAERASRGLDLLDTVVRGIQLAGLAAAARALVQAGDTLTQGLSRLQNATGSVERASAVYEALYRNALSTGVAVSESVDAFQRFAIAAREIGATSDQVVRLVGGLQRVAIVSGASTGEISSATLQLWDVRDRLRELSAQGDPLEKLARTVDFELFRGDLTTALGRREGGKGGRPGFDPVLKFRMLVLQALHGLSLAQTEYLVADRLSWMRFCRLGPGDAVPDADTLWDFREALIATGALERLFTRLDEAITGAGYLPMAGQIVDATLVAAPRQRNTAEEKARIKAGEKAAQIWPDKPARARQKDTDARWTVKFSKAKPTAEGKPQIDIAIPVFGYKSHISIDRRHGVIRRGKTTDAASHDGARLREGLIDPNNTASDVWADTAYRSAQNERYLAGIGKVSRIHRRKPAGRGLPRHHARANAAKSAVRAHVEHPFAHQKGVMGLVIRTIGLARAHAAVTLANMAYNMKRWCWLDRRTLLA